MSRRLSQSERQLWEAFARQLRPLKGQAPEWTPQWTPAPAPVTAPVTTPGPAPAPAAASKRPCEAPKTQSRRQLSSPGAAPATFMVGRREPGLDDTSWRMLSTGRMRPERTLDLHGRTAQAAFALLHGFLLRAQGDQLRCVEIITGLGSGIEGGVLKRELPLWLSRADLNPLVLATSYSHRGNQGAVRLLLRRRRV